MPQARQDYLVLGLGASGRAAARLLLAKGLSVAAADSRFADLADDREVSNLLTQGLQLLSDRLPISHYCYDALVVSPGVPPDHPIYQAAVQQGLPVCGEIELACRYLKSHQRLLAITGTNGKTTVTGLVAHVLQTCGYPARAVGNIGTPLSDVVQTVSENEILVVELSSWQLETLSSQVIDAGIILNITPDHLDRHGTMEAYAKAKLQLGHCLKREGEWYIHDATAAQFSHLLAVYPAYHSYGYRSGSRLYCDKNGVYFDERLEYDVSEHYRGLLSHDVENEMAAFALCRHIGVTAQQYRHAIETFVKPPHRVEFVCERRGVRYFNDSKGTNIDAVIKAVASMRGDIVLIAGGKDKGSAYTPWLEHFADRVRLICAIGEAAPLIHQQLSHRLPVEMMTSLEEAVRRAASIATQGDNVLLSPGCASYDMFENYAHRGREFVTCVHHLPE